MAGRKGEARARIVAAELAQHVGEILVVHAAQPLQPFHLGQAGAAGDVVREIAALAARMMAEDGISDFGFAKRKAAWEKVVADNGGIHPNCGIADTRLLHRARATAVPATRGGGLHPNREVWVRAPRKA